MSWITGTVDDVRKEEQQYHLFQNACIISAACGSSVKLHHGLH